MQPLSGLEPVVRGDQRLGTVEHAYAAPTHGRDLQQAAFHAVKRAAHVRARERDIARPQDFVCPRWIQKRGADAQLPPRLHERRVRPHVPPRDDRDHSRRPCHRRAAWTIRAPKRKGSRPQLMRSPANRGQHASATPPRAPRRSRRCRASSTTPRHHSSAKTTKKCIDFVTEAAQLRRAAPRAGPRDHLPPRPRPRPRRAGRGPDRRLDRRRGLAGGLGQQPTVGPPRAARPHSALRAPARRRARVRRSRPQLGARAGHRLPCARRPPALRPARARRPQTNVVTQESRSEHARAPRASSRRAGSAS
jgi:hypothetical protein